MPFYRGYSQTFIRPEALVHHQEREGFIAVHEYATPQQIEDGEVGAIVKKNVTGKLMIVEKIYLKT